MGPTFAGLECVRVNEEEGPSPEPLFPWPVVSAEPMHIFEASMVDAELFVPWADHGRVNAIHEAARVLAEDHEAAGTRLRVRAPEPVLARLRG